jgi:phospholipase C
LRQLVLLDAWPDLANRFFAMGASSSGLDDSPSKTQMATWFGPSGFQYKNGSIFDLIKKHGMQYRLYNDSSNMFAGGFSLGGQIPIVASLKGITVFDVHDLEDLPGDLTSGYPYTYTFIEPNYGDIVFNNYKGGSSQHPMDGLAAGDALIAYVYNAIRSSPVWNTSLLIITYDEHGGFYDHTIPPAAVSPGDNPDYGLNVHGFNFEQLGVRVPAVIVSPLITKNTIDHTVYDHTSILKTVEGLFSMPSLTARDGAANDLRHLLSASAPRTDSPASIPWMVGASAPPPPPTAARGIMENAAADMEPLPEEGNVFGFLQAAVKADVELSTTEEEKQAAIARFEQIKTKGEAQEYLGEVAAKIEAAKAAQKGSQ